MRWSTILAGLLVVGCTHLPYEHPDGGRVVHTPGLGDSERVQRLASDACARYDKVAILEEPDGGMWEAHGSHFRCVSDPR